MGSGAGLNRIGNNGGEVILQNIGPSTAAVGSPLTGYGTIGLNDSGCVMEEGIGFTKWIFQLLGGATGYSVGVYGTLDPACRPNGIILPRGSTAVPAASWFLLPGPSEQAGTGLISNPMTGTPSIFIASLPLAAVRVVLTATATPTGTCTVVGMAVP